MPSEPAVKRKLKRLSLTKLRLLKRACKQLVKSAFGLASLKASSRGARANLLAGGNVTTSSTLTTSSLESALDGIYPSDCAGCYWSSEDEIDPWFMIKLPKPVYVKTVFYLDR